MDLLGAFLEGGAIQDLGTIGRPGEQAANSIFMGQLDRVAGMDGDREDVLKDRIQVAHPIKAVNIPGKTVGFFEIRRLSKGGRR